jgi:hypothetical protein
VASTPRFSVAAVIRRASGGEFLVVRRPLDDDSLPGVWGLPAVSLAAGELPEAAVRRIGEDKLGVEIDPVRSIGLKYTDRGAYALVLMDVDAILLAGEPDVRLGRGSGTLYVDQRWTEDPTVLRDAAARGSLCCQILLESLGTEY